MTRHYPTIKSTFWLLGFNIIMQIGFFVLLAMVVTFTKAVPFDDVATLMNQYPLWLGVGNVITIGLTVLWGLKKTKMDFRQVFPLRSFSPMILLPIAVTAIGLHILLSDFDNLLRNLLHWRIAADDFLVVIHQQSVWIQIFILMIVAPFTEEFLFRGLIFTGYLNNYSLKKAVLVSAMWFALFHMNVLQFPVAFIGGVLFAWLVAKTNSLWPSLFAHAVMNGMTIFATKVLQVQIPGYNCQNAMQTAFQPLWFDAMGLFLVLAGLGLFWVLKAQTQKPLELLRPPLPEKTDNGDENIPSRRWQSHGLVSLIIGIIAIISLVVSIILAIYYARHGRSLNQIMVLGYITILGFLGCLTGIGLGVAGLLKKQGRGFTWTGLLLNGIYLICLLVLGVISVMK